MSASHPDLLLFLSLPQPHNKLQTSKPLRIYFFGHEVLLPLTLNLDSTTGCGRYQLEPLGFPYAPELMMGPTCSRYRVAAGKEAETSVSSRLHHELYHI